MLLQILLFLVRTAATFLGALLLLRAYMNWLGMPGRNPLAQFVLALTDWLVRPLRRIIPAAGRFDTASLVAALLVAILALALESLIAAGLVHWNRTLLLAPITLLQWALNLVFWLTIIYVLLSWLNPHAPMAPAISMLVRPFLAPFQRIIPPVGGFDLSPLILLVVVQILLLVIGGTVF
jgi:YggT family protein